MTENGVKPEEAVTVHKVVQADDGAALAPQLAQPQAPMVLTFAEISDSIAQVHKLLSELMKEGEHYGTIPGCGDKKVLFKAGAEMLNMRFRFAPKYTITRTDMPNDHREYEIICSLYHIITGAFAGQGVGSCTTMEPKYRYRQGSRVCPECGTEHIYKSKPEKGGGYYCWLKKGGCGAQFPKGDQRIEGQDTGRVENPDIAETWNTVLKMAKKRAFVDAEITATSSSDIFTQDLEPVDDDTPEPTGPSKKEQAAAKKQATADKKAKDAERMKKLRDAKAKKKAEAEAAEQGQPPVNPEYVPPDGSEGEQPPAPAEKGHDAEWLAELASSAVKDPAAAWYNTNKIPLAMMEDMAGRPKDEWVNGDMLIFKHFMKLLSSAKMDAASVAEIRFADIKTNGFRGKSVMELIANLSLNAAKR